VNPNVFAEAYLWAGFSNRVLGENMCDAVFDGGPREPNAKYFERAQAAFGKAIELGSGNFKTAGYAGRAQARVYLKDWAGATSDAQQVPASFVYTLAADITATETRNTIAYANGNTPYRQYSGLNTWYIGYYNQTGDPRVVFTFDARYPNGVQNLPGVGQVAWWPTTKYPANNTPYRIASGREMVLIRAEALLNAGDFQGAMTLINSLRADQISRSTGRALLPWAAANITEAWTYLKRERGIELWLEGRRLGDIRRWEENKTPGVLDWPNYEALSSLFRDNKPSRCFPIPESETQVNPNLK
jgi:starch-binding outer membrane protein, SusD/RagB family